MAPGDANWTSPVSSDKIDGSPTVLPDGAIVIQSLEHKVYVFEPSDGSTRWVYDIDEPTSDTRMLNGIMYYEGFLYFGSSTEYVYKLDADTGSEVATFNYPGTSGTTGDDDTPVVFPDDTVAIGSDKEAGFFGFDLDLNQQWNTSLGITDTNPAVSESGYAFLPVSDGNLYKIDSSGNIDDSRSIPTKSQGASPALHRDSDVVYVPHQNGITAYRTSDLSQVWDANVGESYHVTVDEDTGQVYGGTQSVYALDITNGSKNWERSTSGSGQPWNAVALDTEGKIYKLGGDARVYCFDAAGNQQWVYDTGSSLGDLFSCPAIDGEQLQLYVGDHSGTMHAIEIDAPAKYEYAEAIQYPFYFNNFRHNAAREQSNYALVYRGELGLRGGTATQGNQVVMHSPDTARVAKREAGGDKAVLLSNLIGQP